MSQLTDRFTELQNAIEADHTRLGDRWHGWLLVSEIGGLLNVDFYEYPGDDRFDHFLDILCETEISLKLKRLVLHSPDAGANGTRSWNFAHLLKSDAMFPELVWLSIELDDDIRHNTPIVEGVDVFEEGGALAAWLTKSPRLRYLSAPSAPNADFFKRETHPLQHLNLQAGYATQDFVRNFSLSSCFPELRQLDYQDYNQQYMDNYQQYCTPFEHFEQLFRSEALSTVSTFIWYDPIFPMEQLSQLKKLHPKLHFGIFRSTQGEQVK